jgi:hypothetical protein
MVVLLLPYFLAALREPLSEGGFLCLLVNLTGSLYGTATPIKEGRRTASNRVFDYFTGEGGLKNRLLVYYLNNARYGAACLGSDFKCLIPPVKTA